MKKLKLFAFSLIGVGLLVGNVHAQSIFQADFSSAQGYIEGPLVGQPAGAAQVWQDGAPSSPAVNFEVLDEAMVTTVDLGGNTWVYIMFPVQQEFITATWDWRYVGPADGLVDTGINFSDTVNFNFDGNPALNWNEQGAMIRMTSDTANGTGVIDVRDGDWEGGGSYGAMSEVKYQDGTTIHMRAEIDIVAWTYNVFARREGEQEVQLAQDFGFRRLPSAETNGLNCVALWEDVGDAAFEGNQCIIDNIVVAGPASLPDWSLF